MTRLLVKLEPWTAVSALLGLLSKVQSYLCVKVCINEKYFEISTSVHMSVHTSQNDFQLQLQGNEQWQMGVILN